MRFMWFCERTYWMMVAGFLAMVTSQVNLGFLTKKKVNLGLITSSAKLYVLALCVCVLLAWPCDNYHPCATM